MQEVVEFFAKLYRCYRGKKVCGGRFAVRLVSNWKDWLEIPFKKEEIHQAVCSLGNLKSLGADGMTNGFFKKAWNILKRDFFGVFQDLFSKLHHQSLH